MINSELDIPADVIEAVKKAAYILNHDKWELPK